MYTVNLNCDMGESFGRYTIGNDRELMKYISSANIACGFHAGDSAVMAKTVQAAIQHHVKIGAHPGLPDLHGFGRRVMAVSPQETKDMIIYQIGALKGFAKAYGGVVSYVKPHGALYNMAAADKELAEAIAEAVYQVDPRLVLVGLANSELTNAGNNQGLQVAHEVFADRTYQDDGSLTPRSQPQALITDQEQAIAQVIQMVKHQRVTSLNGEEIPVKADTICIHGDHPGALEFVKNLSKRFMEEQIKLTDRNS